MPEPTPDPGGAEFEQLAGLAQVAEDSGFDSLWVSDDVRPVVGDARGPETRFEAYSLLGALATRTASIGLGAFPSGATVRPPSILAKIVTGVDVISHGRALLALGIDAGDPEAIERLGEELAVCRALLTEETSSFAGRFYQLDHAPNRPSPVRAGGIPLVVVADDPAVAEPAARLADAVVVGGDAIGVEAMMTALDRACAAAGRDRGAVGVIWSGAVDRGPAALADELAALARIGVTGCVVAIAGGSDPDVIGAVGKAVSGVAFPGS
ncbi:MAG TPA: LLM class flavin-dependent oxidoreductase [Acidimicrobiales bacterium]|jgi:alkanesulfonate monooxygenase SsuD/methylene tetrahydromethanopterin reductase-like flavin-dependent oxidoreductase (luciferase family)|nr:LLM class flavin-dependent oxidoreductase [Acidimicrobiales bacterium]